MINNQNQSQELTHISYYYSYLLLLFTQKTLWVRLYFQWSTLEEFQLSNNYNSQWIITEDFAHAKMSVSKIRHHKVARFSIFCQCLNRAWFLQLLHSSKNLREKNTRKVLLYMHFWILCSVKLKYFWEV